MRDYTVYSYTIVHYGADYIGYSLKSIESLLNRLYIFCTPHPSHGHRTDIQPIETREDIWKAVVDVGGASKLYWYDTDFWQEGQQRDYAVQTLQNDDADLILVCDYDEVWHPYVLDKALNYVWQMNGARNWLVNFRHAWRSFSYMCDDQNWPVRIIDTRHSGGVGYVPRELGDIYHFGYAVTDKVMRYKWECHGHKDELRPNWYEEKWQAWPPPDDCHPTNGKNEQGVGWWNPKPFDKRKLPYVMHSHPWFNVDKIE